MDQETILLYSLLAIVIVTTALFLGIYMIWVPFWPARIVHIIYLSFHLVLIYYVKRRPLFVKISIMTTNLIQLSLATFLWFPLTTNYDLFYFLLPMGSFAVMDLMSTRQRNYAFFISFISMVCFFLNRFMGINFYMYELSRTPERIISFLTITSTMSILILYFFLHAHFLAQRRMELEYLANTDTLTNIRNRRSFYNLSQLEFDLAHKYNHTFSLLLLDIDNFKIVNDTYGHDIGDEVLIQLSRKVKDNVRHSDIFARHGGEEFTLLLRQTDTAAGLKIAEKIREQIEQMQINTKAGTISITISIGMAQFDNQCTELDKLVQKADQALYNAKENGRNKVVYIPAHYDSE